MAKWASEELGLPEEVDRIAKNAENAINNVDILLKLIKQVGDVAKIFLMLSNPAALIIRLAAEEIIKLCNDFKEIGVFFLLINPMDKQYANLNPVTYGLKIKQDADGKYLFEPSASTNAGNVYGTTGTPVDVNYQKPCYLMTL